MNLFQLRTVHLIFSVLILFLVAGCSDNCTDVACGPAPPMLQVEVRDTFSFATRLPRTPGGIDTVDTVVTEIRPTIDALVTLRRIDGSDTVAFDTLMPSGDTSYIRNDAAGLPNNPFIVTAMRNERRASAVNLSVRQVEGCCPYSVVGFYRLVLPER